MNPAKIFTSRNNVIALMIAIACGIGIRYGIANGKKWDSAHNELSEWIHKDLWKATDAKLLLEVAIVHGDHRAAQDMGDDEAESIAQAKIDELYDAKAGKHSSQSHDVVMKLLSEKSTKLNKLLFSQPKQRIPLWFIIGLCGFFLILSSLRFALK